MSDSRAKTVSPTRRRRLLRLIPPRRCVAIANSGEQCILMAIVGATICHKHGANAQVRAKAKERITFAEAILNDPRHPHQVAISALHQVDVLAGLTRQDIANNGELTAAAFDQLLEASKTQAAMSKLVLDTVGAQGWSDQEALRQQGDALAKICREMARLLGFDPGEQRVADAFEAAVGTVLYGKRRRRAGVKAIEAKVVKDG